MKRRIIVVAKVFVYNLLFLLLLLIFGEMFLRFVYGGGEIALRVRMNALARNSNQLAARSKVFNSELYRYKPEISIPVAHSEYFYVAEIHESGWRVPCFDSSKPVDYYIIGDSFVFGTGVDDSSTFSCLGVEVGKNIYSMGIPGASPLEYLRIMQKNKDLFAKFDYKAISSGLPVRASILIFTGNDYESLLFLGKFDSKDSSAPVAAGAGGGEAHLGDLISKNLNKLLVDVNDEIVLNNRFYLGDSFLLNGAKLLASRFRRDGASFYRFYSGSTFYLAGAGNDSKAIADSIHVLKTTAEAAGIVLESIILVPDPSEISKDRFARDLRLRGIYSLNQKFDLNHKFRSLLEACDKMSLNCVDTRKVLKEEDYYIYDNHLRPSGVSKILAAAMQ